MSNLADISYGCHSSSAGDKFVQQGCFFFHYFLAASITNWAQIFTGLLFDAYVWIHQVRILVFDNGPFPWHMLITFMHAYRPCWLANAIELCTEQTGNRICVTQPLVMYKTARCSLILPTKTLVRAHYVQFTYFMGRVYYNGHPDHQCPDFLSGTWHNLCIYLNVFWPPSLTMSHCSSSYTDQCIDVLFSL